MTMALPETNPFRRISLTLSSPPPQYVSNNPFDHDSTQADTNPPITSTVPITTPTPAYSRFPSSAETTLSPPRRLNTRSQTEPRRISHTGAAMDQEAPPPYQIYTHRSKSSFSREADGVPYYQQATLRAAPSAEPFNGATLPATCGVQTSDRRFHELRANAEAQRRDIESTNQGRARRRRATGIWKYIACCMPTRRKQVSLSGGKFKRWCIFAVLMAIVLAISIIVVAVRMTNDEGRPQGSEARPLSQILELPGFPPIPTGMSAVQPAAKALRGTTCITPSELWTCNLPPPSTTIAPIFNFEIRHRRTDRLRDGPESIWKPRPSRLPSLEDLRIAGERDQLSGNPTGEETEFVLSMHNNFGQDYEDKPSVSERDLHFDEAAELKRELGSMLLRRQSIADPSRNLPNVFPSLLRNQPLRLYDKGLQSEHYGTYIYFHKQIYLDSINRTSSTPAYNNEVEGSKANYACVMRFTRFKVQIWTRKSEAYVIIDKEQNRMGIDKEFGQTIPIQNTILPYPVTVTEDRFGGTDDDQGRDTICYKILDDERGGKKLGRFFSWTERTYGQMKEGERGCFCEWSNWKERNLFERPDLSLD